MLPRHHLDRIRIAFDGHRLVANAGLVLPATLARRPGLPELVHNHLDLGRATGRATTGDKMMTLVASALAGGDCIDDAGVLRTGVTAGVLDCMVKAPSTLGAFLRSFRWGHVRQLDRVSRELLARAWQAGAGPGDAPFTIDLDSTICETYGLAKEGARHHGYTGSCWHEHGRPEPDPATRRSPSTSIPPSARPTVWPRRAPATTACPVLDTGATPVHGAITRCWPSPPEPATC